MTILPTASAARLMLAAVLLLGTIAAGGRAFAQTATGMPSAGAGSPFVPAPTSTQPRPIVFLSDLHFGLGRMPNGSWSKKEDFRWPKALAGFLEEIGRRGDNRVDLVILGDLLELWQPPRGIDCVGVGDDLGCTPSEMVKIVEAVVTAHRDDLALLRDFAQRGENRLHIIPGNHDSALLLPEVWAPVAAALNEAGGRVALVTRGYWVSPDRRIVAEHGHQVGNDVNAYPGWPRIVREHGGTSYLERPWGERFVQGMFNAQEEDYEIIDNINPESVGVKYRIADRGYVLTLADMARFIAFNLFETSWAQKEALAGNGRDDKGADEREKDSKRWNVQRARTTIGHRLFVDSLDASDPVRKEIEASQALRDELTSLARDHKRLSDDDVRARCDLLSLRKASIKCAEATAGYALESALVPRRHVIRTHIEAHQRAEPGLNIFVYGHTHAFEEGRSITIKGPRKVMVHNTGAFQRTVDEAGFLALVAKKNLAPSEALRTIKLEELPPCYSAVLVTYQSGLPQSKTWRWHMPEDGPGTLVEPGDARCR